MFVIPTGTHVDHPSKSKIIILKCHQEIIQLRNNFWLIKPMQGGYPEDDPVTRRVEQVFKVAPKYFFITFPL